MSGERGPDANDAIRRVASVVAGFLRRSRLTAAGRGAAATDRVRVEPLDLGVSIDPGAPLPHVVADGDRVVLVFHAAVPPPSGWDGTTATIIDPTDSIVRHLGWVVFEGVHTVSLGPPNDEALHTHPLYAAGLSYYKAHELHDPTLPPATRRLIITFHDETFECVCSRWTSGTINADFRTALALAARAVHIGTAAFEGRHLRSAGTELHPGRLPFVQLFWRRTLFEKAQADAVAAGWDVVNLNAGRWTSADDMHAAFAESLSFPDYYGRNLNALADCMYDVVNGDYGFGTHAVGGLIALDGFDRFVRREPEVAEAIIDILGSASIGALRAGWQLATFVQSDDAALALQPFAAETAQWNPEEWLNAKRGL